MKPTIQQTCERLEKILGPWAKPGMFHYYPNKIDSHYPYVQVRAELQVHLNVVYFLVQVDFSLPLGADVEQATMFAQWATDAAEKAGMAHKITADLEWGWEKAMEFYALHRRTRDGD